MLENKSERRVKILLITSIQAKAIRRKQADKKLTAKQAGEEIGVTQVTYRKIRDGGEVKPFIYQKAMEWLAKDYYTKIIIYKCYFILPFKL